MSDLRGEQERGAGRELRPGARVAAWVLIALVTSAIYAPLIANDRPYVLDGVDRRAYDEARRGVATVSAHLIEALEQASGQEEAELRALGLRLDTLRRHLAPDRHGLLDRFEQRVHAARDSTPGERAALQAEAEDLRDALHPDRVGLESVLSFPLFEALSGPELFFMLLWAALLSAPLWGRLFARRPRWQHAALALGLSLLAACAWGWTRGDAAVFDTSPHKDGLTRGTLQAERVLFAPLNLGFAETHISESFRPPTWTAGSRIDERGHYESGPRRPRPDPVTGLEPGARPVEVRFGEPGRNHPWRHFLGTDELGRDLFTRLVWGGRASLAVALFSTCILLAIGITAGGIAGYFGGVVDLLVSRSIEVVQSIPAFFLILAAVALIPERSLHPLFAIVLVIGLVRWTGVARLVRAEVLKLKGQDFVLAARSAGLAPGRIVLRHLLPNALGPVLVAGTFAIAAGVLLESGISFLGFGVKHPIPSWGALINESRSMEHWWIQLFPGAFIFLTVFCTNVVGEALRDALDPRGTTQP